MGSHLEDEAPCVEHNLSIRDLNIMRPIDEVTSTGDFPIVDDYELVEKLYQLLAEHERVIVKREDHVGQYVIDRQDMFKFLSQQKG